MLSLCTLILLSTDSLSPRISTSCTGISVEAKTSFGAATLDGWLYTYGGYDGVPHRYSAEGQSGSLTRYRLGHWETVEQLAPSTSLQGAALLDIPGGLMRVGGMQARNLSGAAQDLWSTAEVACYSLSAAAWETWPALPAPRSSHDAERAGQHVVVMGGWLLEGKRQGRFATTALLLDLNHRELGWREIPAPFQRRALSMAVIGQRVYAIGGMEASGTVSSRVDAYDLSSQQWTQLPDFPGSAFGVAATASQDTIFASGGDGVLWSLREGAQAWERRSTWTFPRFFHQMVASPSGTIVAIGGIDQMRSQGGRVRHIEEAQAQRSTAPVLSRFEVDTPLIAKNRQGMQLLGNELLLVGGNRSLQQHDFGAEDFRAEAALLDLTTLKWRPLKDFAEQRQSMMLAGMEQPLLLGGFAFTPEGGRTQASTYRYLPDSQTFERAPALDLPVPLTQFGCIQSDSGLWVIGGMDYDASRNENAFRVETRVWHLGPAMSEWQLAPFSLEQGRRAFACANLGSQAYLVGGMRENFEPVGECIRLDTESGVQSLIPQPQRIRVSAELVAVAGKLWLVGGSSRGKSGKLEPNRSIECYDPSTQQWSMVVEDLPDLTPHARALALRDRLLIVSTHTQGTTKLRAWILTP